MVNFALCKLPILKGWEAGFLRAAAAQAQPRKARRCGGCAEIPRFPADPLAQAVKFIIFYTTAISNLFRLTIYIIFHCCITNIVKIEPCTFISMHN